MPIPVRIPTPLRVLTQNKSEVVASGSDVRSLIEDLEQHYPGMRDRLVDDQGIRRFIKIFLNDEDVRFLLGLDTVVKEGDTLTIVPAFAGG
jgi:sulfur-carrier protein